MFGLPRRWRVTPSDGFSFGFLVVSVISVFFFELFIVMPVQDEGILPSYIHIILGSFIFVNILSNLTMIMTNDSSTRKIILPSLLKSGWRFCAACEANSPPRTFHCYKCNICVFKRDHHCGFAMCCIGLKNFRYFLQFLFYLSIGSIYATVFNMYFIWDVLGGFSLFSFGAHMVPFIFFVLGYLNIKAFLCTMMSMLSFVGALFVTNLLVFHVRQMIRNQTTFERGQNIHVYDLGIKRNLVESLGKNWHKAWIFALIDSPLPSDGLYFKTKETNSILRSQEEMRDVRQRHI